MSRRASARPHRPRELRRWLIVPAHLRHASGWSDASILNISSRGLLIRTARPLEPGNWVELRRGDHVINARVVWREAAKAGLESDDRLPLEEIAGGVIGTAQAYAPEPTQAPPRKADRSREQGRMVEFAGIMGAGFTLAALTATIVGRALAHPLAEVTSVLR
jgi:hypothetical protein